LHGVDLLPLVPFLRHPKQFGCAPSSCPRHHLHWLPRLHPRGHLVALLQGHQVGTHKSSCCVRPRRPRGARISCCRSREEYFGARVTLNDQTEGKQRPPPPILAAALAADDYFVCSPLADKATRYIRDRCIAYHGQRLSAILFTKYRHGTRWCTYAHGDCSQDLRCMWAPTSAEPPPPYVAGAPSASVFASLPACPGSYVDGAIASAIYPVADIVPLAPSPESLPHPSALTTSAAALSAGLASLLHWRPVVHLNILGSAPRSAHLR
jgi:hypothetical protein